MHPKSLIRRTHSSEFKAQVLAACQQPGASIAAVSLTHGLNSNVVHKWLAGIGMKRFGQGLPAKSEPAPVAPLQFLPVGLAAKGHDRSSDSADIRLDLDLGGVHIKLHCARGSAPSVAALLHAVAQMVVRA
jgi:transposase